jgi:hypothetical protein
MQTPLSYFTAIRDPRVDRCNAHSIKRSVKGKRLDAGWDNDYLLKILIN